jgi:hypothetical protein
VPSNYVRPEGRTLQEYQFSAPCIALVAVAWYGTAEPAAENSGL